MEQDNKIPGHGRDPELRFLRSIVENANDAILVTEVLWATTSGTSFWLRSQAASPRALDMPTPPLDSAGTSSWSC